MRVKFSEVLPLAALLTSRTIEGTVPSIYLYPLNQKVMYLRVLEQGKAQNCQSGYELKNGNCRDINECTQAGTEVNVNQNICRVTTWTSYADGQNVSWSQSPMKTVGITLF